MTTDETKSEEKLLKISDSHPFIETFSSKFNGNSLWYALDLITYAKWLKKVNEESKKIKSNDFDNIIKELIFYVDTNGTIRKYFIEMINEAANVYGEIFRGNLLPQNSLDFWRMVNYIINTAPKFHGLDIGGEPSLIGVPLAAFLTTYDGMPSGVKLFGDSGFNRKLKRLLNHWCKYLNSPKSQSVLNDGPEGWLSKKAKKTYCFDDYKTTLDKPPYWTSWNDFFHREIKDGKRPISDGIVSCNDGFEWVEGYRFNIKLQDKFWLKDKMPYSLMEIFGGKLHDYALKFVNGAIFQTFLGPYNYHRWHAPVSGTVKKVEIIDGCYYEKLIVPDLSGSTTSSLPYLLHVNTRGFVVIDTSETEKIGLVTCAPIGMVEVSSIVFKIKEGEKIKKGQELGYFAFGGSSFAVIFEDLSKYKKKLEIVPPFNELPAPLPTPTGGGRPIQVGQQFAKIVNL